jgi:hypothetical protein
MFVAIVPRRKGMDFYRASNSSSWERLWKALYVEDEEDHEGQYHKQNYHQVSHSINDFSTCPSFSGLLYTRIITFKCMNDRQSTPLSL